MQSSCGECQLFPKSLQVLLMPLTEVHHLREENDSDSHAYKASQLARAREVDSSLIPVSEQGWNLANAPGRCYKDSVSMSMSIPLRPIMHCHKKCRLSLLSCLLCPCSWGEGCSGRSEETPDQNQGRETWTSQHLEELNQVGQDLP